MNGTQTFQFDIAITVGPSLLVEILSKTCNEHGEGLKQSIRLKYVIKFHYLQSLFQYDVWPMWASHHYHTFPQYISVKGKEEKT